MTPLCVIPVRGGSKGIPRKNLAEIVPGVSLLAWTIRQALAVFPAAQVVVSTEDTEMAAAARAEGARVVARPGELARDESTTASVVADLLNQIDPAAAKYDAVMILQVTSPLREAEDVRRAVTLMETGAFDSVVSAFEHRGDHPAKMYLLNGDTATSVLPAHEASRRQDLPTVYRRNGAIFLVTRQHFAATGRLWGGRTGLVTMPHERSIDIDAPEDLDAAWRHFGQLSYCLNDPDRVTRKS